MKVLGIIPARAGSKGIPEKNVKLLGKIPLVGYSIKSALKSKYLSWTMVSTESKEIAEVCRQLGAEVPFLRHPNLSQDDTPTIKVVVHVLEELLARGSYFDAVCLLQPTVPFRKSSFIDRAIKEFQNSNADSLVSVGMVPHQYNPHWTFQANGNNFLNISTGENSIITRRQELPKAFYRDGSIYITKTSVILQEKSLYGSKIGYIENEANQINIDTLEDWHKAEKYLEQYGC